MPIQAGPLVDPIASKSVVESPPDALPTVFQANRTVDLVLGTTLQAVHQAMQSSDSCLLVFQTSLPIRGPSTLHSRDENKLISTKKDSQLFTPQDAFYKNIYE